MEFINRFEFNVDDLSYDVPSTTLLNDLHSFINNEALSDISFIIEGQPIHAHKMMLVRYVRSSVRCLIYSSNSHLVLAPMIDHLTSEPCFQGP